MSVDPIDNDLIERYLLGKLTDAEIRSFKVRLDDDREFARKFRLFSMFPEMMSEPARIEYEKKLAEVATPVVRKKQKRLFKPKYFIGAAVLIIIATGILLLLKFTGTGNRTQEVVKEVKSVQEPIVFKTPVAPAKDTQTIKVQKDTQTVKMTQPEKKEIPEVKKGAVQKAIELFNPAEGMTFSRKDMIRFKWTQKTDSFTRFYIYSVLNDHVILWRGIPPGIREYKVPGNTLNPGKFYWYVGTKEKKRSFIVSE